MAAAWYDTSAADRACKMPKAITGHPGVQACAFGPNSGIAEYRYDVWLREGWQFSSGRMAGCRGGHFNTVAEFKSAEPVLVKA